MNNEPVWTEWLENPGTGDNPVPEFAVGVEMILADGEAEDCEPKSCFWESDAMLPITHYRYQVPADLAQAAIENRKRSAIIPGMIFTSWAPEAIARARRDLGYEQASGIEGKPGEGDYWEREEDDPSAHYQGYQYKGIKLDPYRIARIYNMQGGPREQIMKKCLRFTDKGQTEREVVSEIRSALDRWEEMLEEDNQ